MKVTTNPIKLLKYISSFVNIYLLPRFKYLTPFVTLLILSFPSYAFINNMQSATPNFMGRKEIFKNISMSIKEGRGLIVLKGMAGVGKTQVVKKFANDHQQNYHIVWWFNASQNLESQLKDLALAWNKLQLSEEDKIPIKNTSVFTLWDALKPKLENSSHSWMLIFDDVKDLNDFNLHLPKTSTKNNKVIMITTRDQRVMRDGMKIEPFKREESIQYITKVIKTDDIAYANEIANLLKDHPLAIAQAAAYIKSHPSLTIEKYIALYKGQPQKLRTSEDKAQALKDDYKYTVNMTLEISLNEILKNSKLAYEILVFSSFLSPINIPNKLLEFAAEAQGKEIEYHEAIAELIKHSLLEINSQDEEGVSYTIHELVQEIMRERLKSHEIRLLLKSCIKSINHILPFDIHDLPAYMFKYPHLQEHSKQVIRHAEHYGIETPDVALLAIKLMYFFHYYLFDFNYSATLDHAIELLLKRGVSVSPVAISRYYHTRGNLLFLKDWNDSIIENIKAVKAVEGLDNEEAKQELFFTLVNNLSDFYLFKGDLENAFKALDKSRHLVEKIQNKKSEYLLWSFYALAYINKEKYEEAYKAVEKSLALIPKVEIPDAVFLFVRVNKAEILSRQGRGADALIMSEGLHKEALKLFGSENNHMSLRVLLIKGMSLAKMKKYEKAIKVLKECLEKYDKLAGTPFKDPVQALAHMTLGDIYFYQCQYHEAKNEYEIAEQVFDKIYIKTEVEDISYNYYQLFRVGIYLNDEYCARKYAKKIEEEFGQEHFRTKECLKMLVSLKSKL